MGKLLFCRSDFTDQDRWLALLELAGIDECILGEPDYAENEYSEIVIDYNDIEAN